MGRKSKAPPRRIYFDACILIAYFSTSKEEREKKRTILQAFERLAELDDVQFFTSHWALAETVNVLICRHRMKSTNVAKIEQEFFNTERVGDLKVRILDVSPKGDYSPREYLYHVRRAIIDYHSGVGDCMHWVVINNNDLDTIFTFDAKKDFKKIPNLTVIHPEDLVAAVEQDTI
jgi:predicted nucleic acid-binding protein